MKLLDIKSIKVGMKIRLLHDFNKIPFVVSQIKKDSVCLLNLTNNVTYQQSEEAFKNGKFVLNNI